MPRKSGEYQVSLTFDEINYVHLNYRNLTHLNLPQSLRILDPSEVAITDVHPRYLTTFHKNTLNVPFTVHLYGKNLFTIKEDYVRVYLDDSLEAQNFTSFESEDGLMRLQILRRPLDVLRIEVATDVNMTKVADTVKIKVIRMPIVHAQKVQVYEGEDIDLSGAELFDQLDLWCSVDSKTVAAIVLNSTALRCPYNVLEYAPGLPQGGVRTITIRSDSLHEKLTPGIPSKVSVVANAVPTVVNFSPESIQYDVTQVVNLTMSAPVLPRSTRVVYNGNEF